MGRLYWGDNLDILRERIASQSVDLIYLDPPFNSKRDYNVLFDENGHRDNEAQNRIFTDTWYWGDHAEATYDELVFGRGHRRPPQRISDLIKAMRSFVGDNDVMAYIVMMTIRLLELHRVLKPTGSIYLHCDPTASHYLKVVMDTIWGPQHFRNEIVWRRTGSHSSSKKFGPVHDTLLYYSRGATSVWNPQYQQHDAAYIADKYRHVDESGRRYQLDNLTAAGTRNGSSGKPWRGIDPTERGYHWKFTVERLDELDAAGRIYHPPKGGVPRYKRYLDEVRGVPLQDVWDDIPPLNSQAAERLGYPTQKPEALLARIILASSNEGDTVLDPFCGCGTSVVVAERLNRKWAGIDIAFVAANIIRKRLEEAFPDVVIQFDGIPKDIEGAFALAKRPFDFQQWALGEVDARPLALDESGRVKRGADRGVDGIISFHAEPGKPPGRCIVQVKATANVGSREVRELRGTIEREGAEAGLLISFKGPTAEMRIEARKAGKFPWSLMHREYPRLQILTVRQLLDGEKPDLPPEISPYFRSQPTARAVFRPMLPIGQEPAIAVDEVAAEQDVG